MEIVIHFFRDTLSGPIYIVAVVLAVILIFACIGYLAEKSMNIKKEEAKYQEVGPDEVVMNETVEEVAPAKTEAVAPPAESTPPVAVTTPSVDKEVVSEPVPTQAVSEVAVNQPAPAVVENPVNTEPTSSIPEVVQVQENTEPASSIPEVVPAQENTEPASSIPEVVQVQENVVLPTIEQPK